ncbi:MAG: tetratricopeptide repeat protein, partial [Actinomycetota bacterium]|nr:tetratricopeptide repeat protein [Actinomycetota bacterium]
ALDLPGDRYALYEVDLSSLESDALIPANDLLAEGDFEAAADAYEQARGTDSEDQTFLSNLGLGQSYEGRRLPEEAAPYFEQLAALDPEDETAHLLLADAQEAAGDRDGARTSLERALELAPGDVRLRLRLAELTAAAGDEEAAVRQYRSLVEAFPKVPEYRAKLGGILLLAGDDEAANRQFEEATDLGPVSESIHVGVGDALQAAGRLEGAAARYERAIELDPKNQLYVYKLGTAYARLSTSGRNEEDAGRAEETLTRAASLQPVPSSPDRRGAALLSLGDLYYQWGREEEATTVYEQVLEVDPDSEAARSRLEELRS